VIWLLWTIASAAAAYQLIAIAASIRHRLQRDPEPGSFLPGVSILKPIRGLDPEMQRAVESNRRQDYPEFELLCGAADSADPAFGVVQDVLLCPTEAPNGKVGVLMDLERAARYPVLVVNDSDITVPRDYLRRVVAPLADPSIGVVTCLYRADAEAFAGKWEALGIATDFAPSVLVAPLFGINEFALGSTLAFRAEDWRTAGGFPSLSEYIADDYQLGKKLSGAGKRVYISRTVVETQLGGRSFGDIWEHQVRWARTIRLSRGAYIGLPVTNASLWALLLAAAGQLWAAAALLALRYAMGLLTGWCVLRSRVVLRLWPLMPFRDLWAFGVWLAGMIGRDVIWRDRRIRLDRRGRIVESRPVSPPAPAQHPSR
jgi:ceramide glucosyltransferase